MTRGNDPFDEIGQANERIGRWIVAIIAAGAMAAVLFWFASDARAHGDYAWIQERDKRTGDACCGVNDCYKVTPEERADGSYSFTHGGFGYTVARRETKPSEDGLYWACIPRPGYLRCFFAPPMGS